MASALGGSGDSSHHSSLDGRSHHSSSTDISRMDMHNSDSDPNRTHHLLKHCLSDNQRSEALAQFGTDDVKEAAKEISKMGQRDLQSKFKLVYGTATHSNNNDWLRRKLYEAIGAAPVKAATKSKPRKASKARKAAGTGSADASFHGNVTAAELAERRNRRMGKPFGQRGLSVAETLKRYRGTSSLPGSPVGRSVLEMHRFFSHASATTSGSEEDDSETWQEDGNEEEEEEQRVVRRRASADEIMPSLKPFSAFEAVANEKLPSLPPHLRRSQPAAAFNLQPRRTSSAGLVSTFGNGSINISMSEQSTHDVWGSDAWADAALKAAAARRPSAVVPSFADEDVVMLPMDLSAFDDDAAALL